MSGAPASPCESGWEALRWDPLSWLLEGHEPNLHWRVLVELVRRPEASPAVLRLQGGASAAQPVATLLGELHPDGGWSTRTPTWKRYAGPGWRLLAAVQWGADPHDPRLDAGLRRLVGECTADGGFAARPGAAPQPCLTARVVQVLASLGWCRQPRFREALAWLDEGVPRAQHGGWRCPDPRHAQAQAQGWGCAVTAVGVLWAIAACEGDEPPELRERAVRAVAGALAGAAAAGLRAGHPNLLRTDPVEALAALAAADAPWEPRLRPMLALVQDAQDRAARWRRRVPVPSSLPVDEGTRRQAAGPSRWITLRAVTALIRYAVEAELPRLFPQKPSNQ